MKREVLPAYCVINVHLSKILIKTSIKLVVFNDMNYKDLYHSIE